MEHVQHPFPYPTGSDHGPHRPTVSDHEGHRPTLSEGEKIKKNLTVKEVEKLLAAAGFPRDERSIERYCKQGSLDGEKYPDDQKYYISLASVEKLIMRFQEAQSRRAFSPLVATGAATSDGIRHATTGPRQEPAAHPSTAEEHTAAYDKLRRAYRKLKFNYEVEKRYSSKIEEKFEKILTQVTEQSRQIGMLETELMQVQQLQARNPSNQTPVPRHVAEAEIIDDSRRTTSADTPTTVSPSPHASFADIRQPHPEERV